MERSRRGLVAKAVVLVEAPPAQVWDALTDPEKIKRYMFGSSVTSKWTEGSRIAWKGVFEERPYEDHGVILKAEPPRLLQYTHFSGLSGLPDLPENYHTVTIELETDDHRTRVSLTQDNNDTAEARAHSEGGWKMMLNGLKLVVEEDARGDR